MAQPRYVTPQVHVRMSRTRVIGAVVVLILCAALPVSQLAIAAPATATCCCGPHDADHHCGCDDCPALRQHDDSGPQSPEHDQGMSACDMDGDRPTVPWSPAVVLPAPLVAYPVPGQRCDFPTRPVRFPTRTLRPPCPDG